MVASGVAEEKSSRIMEVMVSTVKPLELMFGRSLEWEPLAWYSSSSGLELD